jgi:hypothetical protein
VAHSGATAQPAAVAQPSDQQRGTDQPLLLDALPQGRRLRIGVGRDRDNAVEGGDARSDLPDVTRLHPEHDERVGLLQLHEGAEPGPLVNPIAWQANFDGYQCLVFLHERGISSRRSSSARPTRETWSDYATTPRSTPQSAPSPDWLSGPTPGRSGPLTDVLPGGTLINAYRGQRGPDADLALPGLLFVGDAVCTTTPNFGRGLATTMLPVDEALRLLDTTVDVTGQATTSQLTGVGEAFDAWTEARMRPWVEDHAVMDEALRRRWAARTSISRAPGWPPTW